jgi:hypothetical protein
LTADHQEEEQEMEFTHIGHRMRRTGIALLAAAISAKAGMLPYASNVPPLPYSIGGLMVNDSGDPALPPQMNFIPPVESATAAPPDGKTGIFPAACTPCATPASSMAPLLSPSFFALVVNNVIWEVTGTAGNVAVPANPSAAYQAASAPPVYLPPPPTPVATQNLNASSGPFIPGLNVTPSNASTPYQPASIPSVNWLPNFVPGATPNPGSGTPDPGFGSPSPSAGLLAWSNTTPINPLIPLFSAPPPPLPAQLTIQGVVYQNTGLTLAVDGVPEPSTFSLIGLALLGLGVVGRKRMSR